MVRFPDGESSPMRDIARRLRERLLKPNGLAHIVFFDRDVSKVVLYADADADDPDPDPDHDAAAAEDVGSAPAGGTSALHERAGRQLYYVLEDLEPDFADLRTGMLIRTILRVPTGAVLYFMVEPGFHLYGATSALEDLDSLDAKMAECVNEIRSEVHYSELDYGSWLSSQGADTSVVGGGAATIGNSDIIYRHDAPGVTISDPKRSAIEEVMDVTGLHYVAYYDADSLIPTCTVDIFERPGMEKFFRGQTPEQRRDKYGRMGHLLPGVIRRMNVSLRGIMRGRLQQVVLDVEQGALYFHALSGGGHLVGVTLDQTRVAAADRRLGQLGRELGRLD